MRSPDNNNSSRYNLNKDDYITEIRQHGYKRLKISLLLIGVWMLILSAIYKFKNETDIEVCSLAFLGVSYLTMMQFVDGHPQFAKYLPFIITMLVVANVTEQQFSLGNPSSRIPQPFFPITQAIDYFNLIILSDRKTKSIAGFITFSYFILRTYLHYGSITANCLLPTISYLLFNNEINKIYEQQLKKISELYTRKEEIAAENFYKTLEIIPQGVILISLSDKDIKYSNQEALVILGVLDIMQIKHSLSQYMLIDKDIQYPQEPLRQANQSLNESIYHSPEYRMSLHEYLMKINNENFEQKDLIFKNKEAKKYLQVKAQIINRHQQDQQVIVILNDITRIKQLESQSKKILSMFFASVAHELRTPLNSIIPMTQKLEQLVKDLNILKYVKIIKNSSLFLSNIIEDALDMSRIENRKFTLDESFFGIKDIGNEVREIMDFQIQSKKLKIFFNFSNNVPWQIMMDGKRYKQILFNLIGNAVKFTFKGSITVNIDFVDNFLITQIIDTGIGIKPEDIDKLFRFFGKASDSKKINRGGMGFGLTISKMILTEMNGDITVNSVYEQGSTFTFRFKIKAYRKQNPLSYSRILQGNIQQYDNLEAYEYRSNRNQDINAFQWDSITSRTQIVLTNESDIEDLPSIKFNILNSQQLTYFDKSPTTLNNSNVEPSIVNTYNNENLNLLLREAQEFKVLVVDDSAYNLFVMSEVLKCIESIGDIQQALNGKEAIEVIMAQDNLKTNTTSSAFDVIFMDLHMPILDGFQTIEKLRELEVNNKLNLEQTKIIAVSAITKNQFRNSANSNLFDDFMEKPVNEIQLLSIFNS